MIYGFKRGFFPGNYREKRAYVRQVIDHYDPCWPPRRRRQAGARTRRKRKGPTPRESAIFYQAFTPLTIFGAADAAVPHIYDARLHSKEYRSR